jgi:hypothetical protein
MLQMIGGGYLWGVSIASILKITMWCFCNLISFKNIEIIKGVISLKKTYWLLYYRHDINSNFRYKWLLVASKC